MLSAPLLAVALVLSLAAAISYLPAGPQATPNNQPSPQPTPAQHFFNVTPAVPSPTTIQSAGSYGMATPAPSAAPTFPPTAIPETGLASNSTTTNTLVLSIVAVLVISVLAAVLLFSERGLKKDLAAEEEK